MIAAWKNHKEGTMKLIEKSKSLSDGKCPIVLQRGGRGWTTLHYAARWNIDTYIIKLLISNGADVNAADESNVTPLHLAADHDRLEALRILLSSGASIDAKDQMGRTALMHAIKGRHVPAAQLLIEMGASVQEKTYQYSMTPLCFAAIWTDSVPLVECILRAGATINDDLDNEECTPVTRAALCSNRAVFEYLLAQGGKIDVVDIFGQQPLQRNAKCSCEKGVRMLLDAKADVDFKDEKWGMTALHYGATTNANTHIAQMLLDSGADINAKDDSGSTPLFTAAFQSKRNILKFLVEKGADLEARNNNELTPLLQMIRSERRDMV